MSYARLAFISRRTSIAVLICLVVFLAASHIVRGQDVIFRVLVSCIPLLGFLPGLVKAHFRAGSWLCFVLLMYFVGFTAQLGIPGNAWGESVALFLTVTLFVSAMMYARWQQRADQGVSNHD